MTITSRKNQYLGLNAHLHSFWQAENRWDEFHNRHIGDLAGLLRQKLLPMGYTAIIEDVLQVRWEWTSSIRSDVSLYDSHQKPPASPATHAQAVSVAEFLDEPELLEPPYRAIGVYETDGKSLVAWIELLSPANKLHRREAYRRKRQGLLRDGVVFIELDYLHETPPTVHTIPDYHAGEIGSHPYHILLLDPRPDVETGIAMPFYFSVDDLIPTITIPLNANDTLVFDFGVGYQKTIEEMWFGWELVDYSALPLHFNRYSPADQLRIVQRMLTVLHAAHTGIDLETGPFPRAFTDLALDEAFAALKSTSAEHPD